MSECVYKEYKWGQFFSKPFSVTTGYQQLPASQLVPQQTILAYTFGLLGIGRVCSPVMNVKLKKDD